ncbi:hypothetical protein VTK26DRAFT_3482 [Humicola hyalothermophila]
MRFWVLSDWPEEPKRSRTRRGRLVSPFWMLIWTGSTAELSLAPDVVVDKKRSDQERPWLLCRRVELRYGWMSASEGRALTRDSVTERRQQSAPSHSHTAQIVANLGGNPKGRRINENGMDPKDIHISVAPRPRPARLDLPRHIAKLPSTAPLHALAHPNCYHEHPCPIRTPQPPILRDNTSLVHMPREQQRTVAFHSLTHLGLVCLSLRGQVDH